MRRRAYVVTLLAVLAVVLSACASGGASAPGRTPSPATSSEPAAAATSTPQPTIPLSGTVTEVTMSTVTLDGNRMFSTGPKTQVLVTKKGAASDLKAGQYVEVTGKKQPDNSVLASTVDILDESLRGQNAGQRGSTDGGVVVNGTIDTVQGDSLTLKPDGGSASVKLSPDATVSSAAAGSLGDIKVGGKVAASLEKTVAQTVSVR